ncbi:Subtilisin DY [Botrimarina colliarenosi]|uniref:Subtilisin DY n=1 Tax=Botrimarina colliarenosi TaxID=2528001 RepID=A0A5C6AJQ8_9BACT|nr:S8 family serine peptidase [Botrimarina colliarenosi]TWT99488.1 Subtilisin DY [Botrimarina colliarenosi]
MARRVNRRLVPKQRKHETLESRVVMSADPVLGLHGSLSLDEEPMLSTHGAIPTVETQIIESAPAYDPGADFWLKEGGSLEDADLGQRIEQTLYEANLMVGQDQVVAEYGFNGNGQTVVVIDTGIAYSHTALGGGVGAGYRVVGGWDFTENDANFYDDQGPESAHGTHVAGIIGADGASAHKGVATGVDLIGLRVFDDAGNGYFSWVEQALQWVHAHRNDYENPVTAVNLSLGTDWNSDSIPSWSTLEDDFARLEADGIFVSVSAGNSFTSYNTKGVSYPAASDHVIPVMSVDPNGQLSYFSQRAEYAIAAPGRYITSTVPDYAGNDANAIDDDWLSMSGTSMAAPYIAGASTLVRQAMEFVGQTGIDQWDIYDHMMATADTFYDSATATNYKRLNLWSAIDALMPADDYGSIESTAYNLGTLTDSSSAAPLSTLSGVISTLEDADSFKFVAGATGTVTVQAQDVTHDLVAQWQVSGAADWSIDSTTGACVFDVVAGQTYMISLSSSDGLGYYDLSIDLEATFAAIEWGSVNVQETRSGLSVSGEQWYLVTANRAGYFTAEAIASSGAANVAIFDTQMNALTTAGARADVQATAGQDLYLRVTGEASGYDLRMTNALAVSGGVATLLGTSDADTFVVDLSLESYKATLNGVGYTIDPSQVSSFNVSAGAGQDSITLYGSSLNETALMGYQSAKLTSQVLVTNVSQTESIVLVGGGGVDTAFLYGSSGSDTYRSYGDRAVMSGAGFYNRASLFDVTYGFANGTDDIAYMYGSSGKDTFRGYSDRAVMSSTTYYNRAIGFQKAYGYANDAADVAWMYGSSNADTYRAYADRVEMSASGYFNQANGFATTWGYQEGGNDAAYFYGSAGADQYRASDTHAIMTGVGYNNSTAGFAQTYAYADSSQDRAWLYGSSGADTLRTYSDRVIMSGAGFYNRATGFAETYGFANTADDVAWMYGSAGADVYRTYGDRVIMSGAGYYNRATGFQATNGYANDTADVAWMYGSAGADTYRTYADRVVMTGAIYANRAFGFSSTRGYADGANDSAWMYDSVGNDTYTASANRVEMAGTGFRNEAFGFVFSRGLSLYGIDSALLYDSEGNDEALVRGWGVALDHESGVRVEAHGFDDVTLDGTTGGSNSVDQEAVDYALSVTDGWA